MNDRTTRDTGAPKADEDDGLIERIEAADVALSEEAGKLRDHPLVEAAGAASEIADQPPALQLAALAVAAGVLAGRPRLAEGGVRAFLALTVAIQTKAAIKKAVVRTRPYKLLDEGHYETGVGGPDEHPYNSFPSGHTADAFAAAQAIGRVAPGLRGPALGLAALIGLVQVPRATHHLADVVAGAAVGVAAEAAVAAAMGVIPQEEMRRVRMGVARRSWLPGAGRGEERTSRG
ncbi:phosphatase PAP2 family protein [Paracoccus panacisoli]|uniref:Phosphatase PAP2 family protein n=1 Tax=Paracoccus panacisoli TaxID=1510163 RepID=A0ABV6T4Y0_9RHOB